MNHSYRTFLLGFAAAIAFSAWGVAEADDPLGWKKFVNEPGQAWLAHGFCDDEEHLPPGPQHGNRDQAGQDNSPWQGGWIRIQKDPNTTDLDAKFKVQISPQVADHGVWLNPSVPFVFHSGSDASLTPAPGCEGADGAIGEIEHLVGSVELHHRKNPGGPFNEPAVHDVEIFLFQQRITEEGDVLGPVIIRFKHGGTLGSHNGIVH
jgi:hypothetical protein